MTKLAVRTFGPCTPIPCNTQVLKGYTVKFFGRHQNPDYAAEAKALATQKGIKVSFPGEVSKEQLTRQMCEAQVYRLSSGSNEHRPRCVAMPQLRPSWLIF